MNKINNLLITNQDIDSSFELVRYGYLKKVAEHDNPDIALKLLTLIFKFQEKIPQKNRANIEYRIYDISQTLAQNEAIFCHKYIVMEETRELLKHLIKRANGFWYYNEIGWDFVNLIEWSNKWQNYQQLSRTSEQLTYIIKAAKHGEFN